MKNLHITRDFRPLLCLRPLFADESLTSYLVRLADANCYEPLSMFEAICKERLSALGIPGNLTRSDHPETYDVLSGLTGTSPRALAQATIHRFAHAPIMAHHRQNLIYLSDGQHLHLFEKWLRPRKLRLETNAQFCPACLQEGAYHRLIWSLREVTACCRHRCLLLQACPVCGAGVGIGDVVKCRCPVCDTDLRGSSASSLQNKPFDLFVQYSLQNWWGAKQPDTPIFWELPHVPISVLYQVWEKLLASLGDKLMAEYNLGLADTLPGSHEIQVIVFYSLIDWPQGFYAFLQDYLPQKTLECSCFHPGISSLNGLWESWRLGTWAGCSEFAFVQTAFNQFLGELS
jgi:hypothetical protein